ncbi:MAG: hypothetical protein HYT40_01520 [Candidatus Sungbacteria bacterium]|uniref:Uncharacterized protein n=1 Tax=Candidatus Sungiibacteriota bacterium TaxID=2750080 RepID=A0A931SB85_9BACT|nr:hypothetical protein [Candidatus Sungbacteria bacterium]
MGTGIQLTLKPVDPVFQSVLLRRFMAAGPSTAPGRGLYTALDFSPDELELIGFTKKDISEMLCFPAVKQFRPR